MNHILGSRKRQDWIDVVKFWGMLAIVWGHTLSDGNVRHYLYSFHVPLFFFVVGLFFTSPKRSFWHFTAKRAKDLLIPYFLFASISILIFSVLGNLAGAALNQDVSGYTLSANLVEMLTGQCRANRPLWFLPCMFVCYLLCFAIARALENGSVCRKRTAAVVIAGISVFLCFMNERFWNIGGLFFKIDVAVFMLAFISVAYLLKPLLLKRFQPPIAILLAMLLLTVGGITAFTNSEIDYLGNHYGNVFLFFASAVFTIIGFCMLSILMTQCNWKIITAPLVYIGKHTLPILLMHKFPILFFQVIFPWTKQPMKENNPFVGLFVATVSIAACLGVDVFMQKAIDMFRAKAEHSASRQK